MKKNLYICMLAMLVIYKTFADDLNNDEWGATTNNVQMSIKLKNDKVEIKAGEPIRLFIRIKNVSTDETFCGFNSYEKDSDLSFIVVDPLGKDASPKYPKDSEGVSSALVSAPPNQTSVYEFNLDGLCQLGFLQKFDKAGTYKIISRQRMFSNENKRSFVVVSNPLYVTILPGK